MKTSPSLDGSPVPTDEGFADIWEGSVLRDEIGGGLSVEQGEALSNGDTLWPRSASVSPTELPFSCLESNLAFLDEREDEEGSSEVVVVDEEGSCSATFGCLCEASLDLWVSAVPDLAAPSPPANVDIVEDGGKDGREDGPGCSGGRGAWFLKSEVGEGS